MAFGSTFQNDLCKLIFQGAVIANIAENATTAPSTALWLSLHTADPTGGTQGTNEGGYAAYTRIAVARSTAGFDVTDNVVAPLANVDFPQAVTTSTGTFTYAGIGLTSGATDGKLITQGPISGGINFGQNVIPRLTTGSTFTLT
jgi:hypothetical protein